MAVNWDSSGGGAFAIIPLNEIGKAPDKVSLFRGHKGPVLDTAFNPFNERQLVSCSDDGDICLWEIPEDFSFHKYLDEEDNVKDIITPLKVLSGHSRKVGHIQFHPCAKNVIASSSLDYTVKLWNLETGKDEITLKHNDLVTSFAFNYNGSLLATTSRDKKLRVWDIRSQKVISEGNSHTGAKPSRVVWVGNTDRVITTGFSKLSDRQVGIWDVNKIDAGPIGGFNVIDSSSGVLIPVFDDATSILYLIGKGDGNIRYYEYDNDILHELSEFASTDPQRGFAVAPKASVSLKDNEILRAFKTVNDNMIEPISFIVPRKSETFQQDIYPDCPSDKPALTAEEFFAGKDCNGPLLISMRSLYEGTESDLKESQPPIQISSAKIEQEKKKQEEKSAQANKLSKDGEKEEAKKENSLSAYEKEKSQASTNVENKTKVDDVLKNSSTVNSMLDKVNNLSENEDNALSDNNQDDWNDEANLEQKTPDLKPKADDQKKETYKNVASSPAATTSATEKPSESTSAKGLSSQDSTKEKTQEKSVLKEDTTKTNAPRVDNEEKEDAAKQNTTDKPTLGNAPTLKQTVHRLAEIVEDLKTQVDRLVESGLHKDDKISSLESKIDELLKR